MSTNGLEDCFTCFRQTEDFRRITDQDNVNGENIETIFVKHFWFTKDDCRNRIVCTSCWEKIDEFHKFYCRVEKIHAPSQLVEVKLEPAEFPTKEIFFSVECDRVETAEDVKPYSSYISGEPICKLEETQPLETQRKTKSKKNGDDHVEVNDDVQPAKTCDKSNSDSSPDSDDIPLASRMVARKRKRSQKSSESHVFTCHVCAGTGTGDEQEFATFYQLNVHFKKVHNSRGYVFCCNRKWTKRKAYFEHFNNHGATIVDQKRCLPCNRTFYSEGSYAMHMSLVHTPDDQKQFKCDQCSNAFAEEDLLKSHIKWHEEVEKKNHYCSLCNKYFSSEGYLMKHNMSFHETNEHSTVTTVPVAEDSLLSENAEMSKKRKRGTPEEVAQQEELIGRFISLNCLKCDFLGGSFLELAEHARKVHQMKTPVVVCCERRFSKRLGLYEHCLKHLNPDHFKCEQCGKVFTDSSGLQNHKWYIHTPLSERPFKCDICGDAFVKDYVLKQHMDRHMDKERRTHSCELCDKTYTGPLQLKSHMHTVHGAISNWVCDVCARGFTHRSLLEQHRKTHTEEGLASLKVQCEKCKKWLTNRKNYLRHKRHRHDSGPATCDVCGLVSVNKASLDAHIRLHHSSRPKLACTYCGKEFKKQLRLKEHEANHEGVVLYKCPYCPRMCNSSSNMYAHKKSAHAEEWAKAVAARRGDNDPDLTSCP